MRSPRKLLSLLLAVLLLAGQWAGQLHGLAHAGHELAVAKAAVGGGESAPPLDHARDHCLAFHALEGASPAATTACPLAPATHEFVALPAIPAGGAAFIAYSSRAPPARS